jgi:hypothetical protein
MVTQAITTPSDSITFQPRRSSQCGDPADSGSSLIASLMIKLTEAQSRDSDNDRIALCPDHRNCMMRAR